MARAARRRSALTTGIVQGWMVGTRSALRSAGARIAGARPLNRALHRLAAARGRGLALVYHRVLPRPQAAHEVVPCVPVTLFHRHLEALAGAGRIVPLAELLDEPDDRARPRFAITFDDDYPSHAEYALPVLAELGLPATFFLSGRDLHGLGGYWWEALEALVAERGLPAAAAVAGVTATSAQELAGACEAAPERQRALLDAAPAPPAALGADGLAALKASGMTIGFHTVEHPLLTTLGDAALDEALTRGRTELEHAAGQPISLFAYPHGKADRQAAEAARRAGYAAAFTGRDDAITQRADRHLLGRWEAGPVEPELLLARAARRLLRSAAG